MHLFKIISTGQSTVYRSKPNIITHVSCFLLKSTFGIGKQTCLIIGFQMLTIYVTTVCYNVWDSWQQYYLGKCSNRFCRVFPLKNPMCVFRSYLSEYTSTSTGNADLLSSQKRKEPATHLQVYLCSCSKSKSHTGFLICRTVLVDSFWLAAEGVVCQPSPCWRVEDML